MCPEVVKWGGSSGPPTFVNFVELVLSSHIPMPGWYVIPAQDDSIKKRKLIYKVQIKENIVTGW